MQGHDRQSFEPVTMGHIRSHGCRDLLVYCESGWCNHSAMEILPFRNGRFEWTAVRARADCQHHMTRIISYLSANVSPCQRLAPRPSPVSPNPGERFFDKLCKVHLVRLSQLILRNFCSPPLGAIVSCRQEMPNDL
jgi:hypothetical protein